MQREVSAAAGVTRDEGLQELYERHAPAAGRLAYLLTGDRSLAEDLVQEAFVRLVARFRHLRVPDASCRDGPWRSSASRMT